MRSTGSVDGLLEWSAPRSVVKTVLAWLAVLAHVTVEVLAAIGSAHFW